MTLGEFTSAKAGVFAVAMAVANNGKEQQALVIALNNIERDGGENRTIIKNQLACILDGLAYGNWPWMKNGVSTL